MARSGLISTCGLLLAFAGACSQTQLEQRPQLREAVPDATGVVYHDKNHNQVCDSGERGLAGVRVSNGRDIVRTDRRGRYRLPVGEDTIIFVIKPRGWMTPVDENNLPQFHYIHKPAGSPELEYAGVAPTGPLPESIDFALYPRKEPRRFRMLFMGDPQPASDADIQYLAHDVVEELADSDAQFCVALGDLVYNELPLLEPLNETVGLLGMPWYPVLGNHDENYDAPNDQYADETFERVFGPPYYSFDYGPVHFVVLDDVIWVRNEEDGKGRYHAGLGARQLRFVANDLALLPKQQLVVLSMHIPIDQIVEDGRVQLFALLAEHLHTLSVSAHMHEAEHLFMGLEQGWPGDQPHHHIVAPTACGGWWSGAPDELGIPHTLMRDGGPNGVLFATFDGNDYSFEFKPARRPANYQMDIHAPEAVTRAEAANTEVLVNVFFGSEFSTVEMRVDPTEVWIPLERVERKDPNLERIKAEEETYEYLKTHRAVKPIPSPHFWRGTLPAGLEPGLRFIHVRTTDMFGQTYQARRAVRITGDE